MKDLKGLIYSALILTVICAASALLLAGVRASTSQQIENQILKFVKKPAIEKVLAGSTNDPIYDRVKVKMDDGSELDVFIGKFDGKTKIAFETQAEGYGGTLNLMVGVDPETETLVGIGVTTHKESPGVGSRVTEEPFGKQFPGLTLDANISIKADGGVIDAVSGATVSSRGACEAVRRGIELYKSQKDKILEVVKNVQ